MPKRTLTPAQRLAARFANAPLVKWDTMAAKLNTVELHEASRNADSEAERFATVAAYLAARSNGNKHETARKLTNRRTVKVRRALGYSYPEAGVSTGW